jgi:hypothetical protein
MLIFVTSDGHEIGWHRGDKNPELFQPKDETLPRRTIVEAQADGTELEYIIARFRGIPCVDPLYKKVQVWKGPYATFIFDNLPNG